MARRTPGKGGFGLRPPVAKTMMPVFPTPAKAGVWPYPPRPAMVPRPTAPPTYGKAASVTGLGVAPAVKLGGLPTNPVHVNPAPAAAAPMSMAMVPFNPTPPTPTTSPASSSTFGFELCFVVDR